MSPIITFRHLSVIQSLSQVSVSCIQSQRHTYDNPRCSGWPGSQYRLCLLTVAIYSVQSSVLVLDNDNGYCAAICGNLTLLSEWQSSVDRSEGVRQRDNANLCIKEINLVSRKTSKLYTIRPFISLRVRPLLGEPYKLASAAAGGQVELNIFLSLSLL